MKKFAIVAALAVAVISSSAIFASTPVAEHAKEAVKVEKAVKPAVKAEKKAHAGHVKVAKPLKAEAKKVEAKKVEAKH